MDDAIQDDGPGAFVAFEPCEARWREPARKNSAIREGPNDLEARETRGGAGPGLLTRDEDADSSSGRQLFPDPGPDVELRRRGVRREGGRGQDRGREEGACGAEEAHGTTENYHRAPAENVRGVIGRALVSDPGR